MKISNRVSSAKLFTKCMLSRYLLISLGVLGPFLKTFSQDYFQQEVNYNIHVTLNDRKHELKGFESVVYINNSPDTLRFLYFHLWPNAYSNNKTELARQLFMLNGKSKLFNDPELRGYIDSLDFKVEGQPVQWDFLPGLPDICKIILTKPLKHGDSLHLNTPFHVKIPKGVTSLLGHIGESYQVSQWFPKPAVYDRSGWHQIPYLDQGEFYSEFGSFDVSITLPVNYVVAATGNLQNEEEKKLLDKLSEDTTWTTIPVKRKEDFPPSSQEVKTLRYTQDHIHDFAWFADKSFRVRKGKVILLGSGREVTTWVMFPEKETQIWKYAISYVNDAIRHFSKWIGEYPYNSFTAVQSALSAGSGMEYPGLTVIAHTDDPYLLDGVIAHETCHNWYYSALGSNERKYPFMDESIVSAYETRYLDEKYPGKKLWEIKIKNRKVADFLHIKDMPVQRVQELEWLTQARNNLEQPANLAAPDYNRINYSTVIYNKAAQGFNYLRAYLGNSLFDSIMHDYYLTWKYKHPQPEDLSGIFESHATKDLSWFFDDFLGTTKRLDYKIVRLRKGQLLVKNKGELNSPLVIAEMNHHSICSEKWEEGFKGMKWINLPQNNYSAVKIDPEHTMPELFRLNNNIRSSGICRKADPLQLRFLYTIEDPDKQSLIYFPAFDWNNEDGFMAGVALNNGTLITKPLEYLLIPFYSFRNQKISGYGKISFNIIPYDKLIRMATFSLEGSQFGAPGNQDYKKFMVGSELYFRSKKINDAVNHKVFGQYIAASDLLQIELLSPARMRSYLQFGYQLERAGKINPLKMAVTFESGSLFQKTSMEFNYKYSYNGINKGLEIRLFAGTMLKNASSVPFYAFSVGGRSGRELYLYQGLYPNRFDKFPGSFWTREMDLSEGGLVSPVNDSLGYSRSIFSLSLSSDLPAQVSWLPLKPFANIILNDHSHGTPDNSHFYYEAGFKAGIRNFFEIYVPLLVSKNIDVLTGSFKDRIRFVFKLNLFDPLRL